MQMRNATVAVIGAGDYNRGGDRKKIRGLKSFIIFAGRRDGDKLAPLVADIEAQGGRVVARRIDARKEDEMIGFLKGADEWAPLRYASSMVGANVNFSFVDTTERVFRKVWEMACYAGFLAGREAARLMLPEAADLSSLPAQPRVFAAAWATQRSRAPSSVFAP